MHCDIKYVSEQYICMYLATICMVAKVFGSVQSSAWVTTNDDHTLALFDRQHLGIEERQQIHIKKEVEAKWTNTYWETFNCSNEDYEDDYANQVSLFHLFACQLNYILYDDTNHNVDRIHDESNNKPIGLDLVYDN